MLRVWGCHFCSPPGGRCESGSGASFKMVLHVFMLIRMLRWRLGTRLSPIDLVSVSFLACLLLVICDMTQVPLKTFTADEIAAAGPSMEPALEGLSHSGFMKWSSLHFRVVDITGREMFASPDSTENGLKAS